MIVSECAHLATFSLKKITFFERREMTCGGEIFVRVEIRVFDCIVETKISAFNTYFFVNRYLLKLKHR